MADDRRAEREALVDRLTDRRDLSSATEQAMRAVPRHAFVPSDRQTAAYDDSPLPIGEGQTISAPHMVAVMTDLLDADEGDRVLEVGTGCGYHAAVTAELVGADPVYSVEYHDSLAREARKTLRKTGYEAVSVRAGDGREGWPAHAPYDRAYLTGADRPRGGRRAGPARWARARAGRRANPDAGPCAKAGGRHGRPGTARWGPVRPATVSLAR